MFTVFFITLGGIALGYILRNTNLSGILDKIIMLAILLLLFSLGSNVGGNAALMENLPGLGGQAGILTLAGITGSILCGMLVSRFFFKK